MKEQKIKFVRKYAPRRETIYDVVYHSRRLATYTEADLPKTVQKFVEQATEIKEQYDTFYKCQETIYTA